MTYRVYDIYPDVPRDMFSRCPFVRPFECVSAII